MMEIIETPIFTKLIIDLISDDSYSLLQEELAENPEKGKLLEGGGGIRKIRWKYKQGGKSGGLRIIYYFERQNKIYMLYAYPKNEQEDLTREQIKIFKSAVKEHIK